MKNNQRLDETGKEVLDPVPHATTIGFRPGPSMEDRIRMMLKEREILNDPDYGMDSDDPDDFGKDGDMPLYDFERRYEEIRALEDELIAAREDVEKEKALYRAEVQKKRAAATENVDFDPDDDIHMVNAKTKKKSGAKAPKKESGESSPD